MNNAFTITYLLFGILVLLAAILVAIMALPGPKRPGHKKT